MVSGSDRGEQEEAGISKTARVEAVSKKVQINVHYTCCCKKDRRIGISDTSIWEEPSAQVIIKSARTLRHSDIFQGREIVGDLIIQCQWRLKRGDLHW